MDNTAECRITDMARTPKFIRPANMQEHIEIELELSEATDIYSRILLRKDDRTIGMGYVLSTN